jgi:hypothetical protein
MLENGNNNPIARVMLRVFQILVPPIPSGNYHPVEIPWTGAGEPRPPTGASGVASGRNNAGASPRNGSSK